MNRVKKGINPVEKIGVATPDILDASTFTDNIFDSSVDTDDSTMEKITMR